MNFLESSLKPKTPVGFYFLVVFLAFLAANTFGLIPLITLLCVKIFQARQEGTILEFASTPFNADAWNVSSNLFLFLLLFSFVVGFIVLIPLIKYFSKRNYKDVINGTNRIRWSRIGWGAAAWTLVSVIYLILDYFILDPSSYILQFDLSKFIPLIFITILMVPLQTTFEEMAFRGYLTQGIAGATGNRWWALIIPSFIFGFLHILNPEVGAYGLMYMMPQYLFFGLLFGLVSILDDGIEIAIGLHAANNMFICLFTTSPSMVFSTASVFEFESSNPIKELIVFFITGIVVFLFFYRKYNWDIRIMNEKVETEIFESEAIEPLSADDWKL